MKRSQLRRMRRRKVPVPLASMGDIAFLLIIFFMIVSEFAKDKDVELESPTSDQVAKQNDTPVILITIDKDENIYVDGEQVDDAEDVKVRVRAKVAGAITNNERQVQFKADRSLPQRVYQPVFKAIAEAGGVMQAVGELPR